MYAYKDLLELAGLTTRLYTLLSTLLNLQKGYEPLKVEHGDVVTLRGVDVRIPRVSKVKKAEEISKGVEKLVDDLDEEQEKEAQDGGEDPPLVKDLNLVIKRGDHMMITGSNGVGKTAVARVLAGLWDATSEGVSLDAEGARVEMPKDETEVDSFLSVGRQARHMRPRPTLYVLPQRSYMPVGSLLEQIIYPCSYASFVKMTSNAPKKKPVYSRSMSALFLPALTRTSSTTAANVLATALTPSEAAIAEIHEILEKVHLGYLIEREGGLHARKEWRDVLSGGEKQRMGMARVLWWRPKWAVLDGV